jgi:hypothetical protein
MCSSSRAMLAMCLWICGGAAMAGTVTHSAATQEPPLATPSRLPSIPAQARAIEGYQLRCWQYGKLIIDEFRSGAMPEAPDAVLRLQPPGRGGVIDARNATCFIKPQSRAAAPPATPSP